MKVYLGLVVLPFLLVTIAVAQSDADYQGWMKSTAAATGSLNKDLSSKSGDAVATDVKTLEDNMTKVADYWRNRNVSDADRFADDAKSWFAQVGNLAASGNFTDASSAMQTAQADCVGCHTAHREKTPDGTFKIKMK